MSPMTTDGSQTSGMSATFLGKELRGGRYLIEEKISQGGSAWLFRARHATLDEPMAVKILYPQFLEDQTIRQRFIEEARIQFRLRHQNIVQTTDVINEEFCLGSVMEWIEGQDLRTYLRHSKGPKSATEIEQLLLPIIQALSYVHQQELVHRDIKPANILLQPQGQGYQPKLTDFGIAKMLMAESNTVTGSTLGTVTYMSPEQINDAKYVTAQADIYSLGVILYEMVTGRVPFKGNPQQQVIKHLSQDPPAPRSLHPGVNEAMERVVLWCLQKAPDARPDSCETLLFALHDALKLDARKTFAQRALPVMGASPWAASGEGPHTNMDLQVDQLLNDEEDFPTTLVPPEMAPGGMLQAMAPEGSESHSSSSIPIASSSSSSLPAGGVGRQVIGALPLERRRASDLRKTTQDFHKTQPSPVLPLDMDDLPTVPPPRVSMGVTPGPLPAASGSGHSSRSAEGDQPPLLMWAVRGAAAALVLLIVIYGAKKLLSSDPAPSDQAPATARRGQTPPSSARPWLRPKRDAPKGTKAAPRTAKAQAQVCFNIVPSDVKFRFKFGTKMSLRRGSFCLTLKRAGHVILWRYGFHSCEFDVPKEDKTFALKIKAKHVKIPKDKLDYCVAP